MKAEDDHKVMLGWALAHANANVYGTARCDWAAVLAVNIQEAAYQRWSNRWIEDMVTAALLDCGILPPDAID